MYIIYIYIYIYIYAAADVSKEISFFVVQFHAYNTASMHTVQTPCYVTTNL